MNVGEIRNQGFEFMVNATPVHTKNFSWETTFNFAYNDSEVKYLGGVKSLSIDGASARSGNVTVRNIVGQPYGMLVGYKYARDEQGRVIHKNGIPQATDELQNLGNGVYKYTGGWSNTLRFRDFSLSFLIDYKAGASLFLSLIHI